MSKSAPTGPVLQGVAAASLAAVALFLAAGSALGLQGRVVMEATGTPIAGAEVSVLGLTGAQRTDTDGRFLWLPDPVAPFEVLIVLPGGRYMKPFLVTSIPAGGLVTIPVRPIVEESVSVTAGAAPSIESPPANGTTIVPKADIESRQPANLVETLENVAGVSRGPAPAHSAVPAIRGLANGRSLILIDGARVSSERRAGPGAAYLDPFILGGVEVSRGPGSVAYGSDAFGGVISARTRDVAPGAPPHVEAIGDYGLGIPGGRVGVAVTSPVGQDGGILVAGHYRSYENYDSPDGEVLNSGYRDTGVLVSVAYILGPGTLTAGWQGDYARDIGIPTSASVIMPNFSPEENSSRFTLSYDTGPVGGFSRIALLGFIGSNDGSTAIFPSSTERVDVSAKDFQVRTFAERFVGPVRVEVGLDVNGRYGLHAVDVTDGMVKTSVEDAHRADIGGYLTAEAALLPQLTLQGGVRGDGVRTVNEGGDLGDQSTSNSAIAGNVALTAGSFGGFSVTGQYAHGFRDPVLSDRYFVGLFGRGFIRGNPNLEFETSNQYDVALRYTNAGFRTAFYMYDYHINNLIEQYPNPLYPSERPPRHFLLRNRSAGAKLQGLELEAQVALPAGFAVALAGQIERGATVDDDRSLDGIPPESLTLQVRKGFGPAFVQARWVAYAGDNSPGPTQIGRPGYSLLDLGAGYSFFEHFELQAYVRNVLNKTYLNTPTAGSTLAPGTSATLTGFVRF